MNESTPVIQVEDLHVGYDEVEIVKGVSLEIPRGKITCVVGPSGSGKSTLVRSMIGLLPPTSGRVKVFGEDIYDLDRDRRQEEMFQIGVMFQHGALLGSLTVKQNLAMPLKAHTDLDADLIDDMIKQKLALVGLSGHGDKLPSALSGGMRKRAGLARSLMLDPQLVVCDEPGAGLDPMTAAGIDKLLLRMRKLYCLTLLIVTHELQSIRRTADQVIMVNAGRIHFSGTLDEALASEDELVSDFFNSRWHPDGDGRQETLLEALGGTP